MSLPEVTHLQWLVLSALLEGDRAGYRIREVLAKHGVQKSGPSFYQLMARLEDDGLVKGWYVEKVIAGQPIKERHYKLTGKGAKSIEEVTQFYQVVVNGVQGGLANA
jgi:DNA-binding PadR family transcriptional regulator